MKQVNILSFGVSYHIQRALSLIVVKNFSRPIRRRSEWGDFKYSFILNSKGVHPSMYKKPFCHERKRPNADRCFIVCLMFSSSSSTTLMYSRESVLDAEFKAFLHFVDRIRSKYQRRRDILNKISNGRDSDRSATS